MVPFIREARCCKFCGYRDPSVYPNKGQPICAECWKRQHGKTTFDIHHLYGRSRDETISIPANLHAYITEAKKSWPKVIATFPTNPLLQIAYTERNEFDLVQWMRHHMSDSEYMGDPALASSKSELVLKMLYQVSLHFERSSDWLIAVHGVLLKKYGANYSNKLGIAPLFGKDV